ncbi:MAG: hypothetical protein WD749_15145 [Phycisphaerales bacterium]
MHPFSDLWVRLARLDLRWRMLVETVYIHEEGDRRQWCVTLSPREGEGESIRAHGDTLVEALLRSAEAAEAREGRSQGRQ